MRLPITHEQQQEIDGLLFKQYADGGLGLNTMKRYRDFTGAGINDAVEALVQRRNYLRSANPSQFTPEPDWRLMGLTKLLEIKQKEPIVVIEGEWDADSFHFYVRITAITSVPSPSHPLYTEHPLTSAKGTPDEAAEKALHLGNELAAAADVGFVLNPYEEEWERRWWHRHG
jgi:hypothetical protein